MKILKPGRWESEFFYLLFYLVKIFFLIKLKVYVEPKYS